MSTGEDMSADGRRQLALFLVSGSWVRGGACTEGRTAPMQGFRVGGPVGGVDADAASTYLPCLPPQARKHLHNFEATHCTPLPAQHFQMPWHL